MNGTDRCALCTRGKYNTQLGRTACSNCSVGLYATDYGAKGADSCLECPAGQWSPEGSPDCKMCPVNSAGPQRSGSISNCICNAGYTGPEGGPCVVCATGMDKDANGTEACASCVAGQYQPELEATSARSCTTCATDTFSNESTSAVCTACPTGFKALPGTTTSTDCCGLNSSPLNATIDCSTTNLAMSCGSGGIQSCPVLASSESDGGLSNDGNVVTGYTTPNPTVWPGNYWDVYFQRVVDIVSVTVWNRPSSASLLVNFRIELTSNNGITWYECVSGQNGARSH